jgi:carboxymethylenebutenolidase
MMKSQTTKTSRRRFLKETTAFAGGSLILTVLPAGMFAQITKDNDPRLITDSILYDGVTVPMIAYQARPVGKNKYPAVIVIHENRGLQPHIKDVARRIALQGFVALAPDALSPFGGTPDKQDEAVLMIQKLDKEATIKNLTAAVKYLKTSPLTTGKVGCTGFCWGGGMTNQVAVNAPDLNAAVPYYGAQPKAEDVAKIKCPMLLQYAGNDERINQGIPEFEKALKEAKVEYQIFIYQGAEHAFNNDTNPERYNKEAADLAWGRTIKFFNEKL